MPDLIPYARQSVTSSDIGAVEESLSDDFLTTGPRVAEFEAALAKSCGARHATAVSSGTAALHTAYAALGVGPGDEVVVPALTFAATANAALYLRAKPVFADIGPDGTLDPASVEAAINDRTRLVVPVDYAGLPADYEALRAAIRNRAMEQPIQVVADAAHSLGASYRGRTVGTLADATALSFHPVKHITTGEGGAVITDLDAVDAGAQTFRSHGIVRDSAGIRDVGPWYQEMRFLGFNYRLTDFQCALGLSQLRRLDALVRRRREIAARYRAALRSVPGIELPLVRPDAEPSWHLYVIRVVEADKRRPFFEALRAAGLGVQVHYIPVYWHPFYRDLGYAGGTCPRAEDFYRRAVSIPMFPAMTDSDIDRVIETVDRVGREILA